MVSIKRKIIDKKTYYYIEHSYRKNGQVLKKEKYLGTKVPKNIKRMKNDLLLEVYDELWYKKFDVIKENYKKNKKKMPKSIQEKELETFAVKFTYATNKIEGSTLTHRETSLLLEKGITPANRPIEDIKEAEQHREVFYDMINYDKKINISTLIHWHKKLFEYTKKDKAGKIRTYSVGISGSRHLPPEPFELDFLIKKFFVWYNQNKNNMHPVHLAALVHFRFVSIHPFGDGNGRITRLFMNYVLHKKGYPMLIIDYSKRNSYYNALENSNVKNDESIFTLWFFRRYLRAYEKYFK
ncbi:MAG: Fic family protein [Candidatus Thermoplasmatota archaeon]|nr:Fic family protein [Candidatus Thermoplasmatota archaeon]